MTPARVLAPEKGRVMRTSQRVTGMADVVPPRQARDRARRIGEPFEERGGER
jgi:hypothetical protein